MDIAKLISGSKDSAELQKMELESEFHRNLSDLVYEKIGKKSHPIYNGNGFSSFSHNSQVMQWKIDKESGGKYFVYMSTKTSEQVAIGSPSHPETNGIYLPDLDWSLKMDFVRDIRDYSYFYYLGSSSEIMSLEKRSTIPSELLSIENSRVIEDFVNNYLMVLNLVTEGIRT